MYKCFGGHGKDQELMAVILVIICESIGSHQWEH